MTVGISGSMFVGSTVGLSGDVTVGLTVGITVGMTGLSFGDFNTNATAIAIANATEITIIFFQCSRNQFILLF